MMPTALLLFAAALAPRPAQAATVLATVCIESQIDFVDADSSVGDDHVDDHSDLPTRGVHLQLLSGGTVVKDVHVAESGPLAGCKSVLVDNATSYTVKVLGDLEINAHTVALEKYVPHLNPFASFSTAWTSQTFPSAGTYFYELPDDREWQVAAIVGHALERDDLGLESLHGGADFHVRVDPNNDHGKGTSWDRTNEIVYVGGLGDKKYPIVHELGHAVGHYLNHDSSGDPQSPARDYNYAAPFCDDPSPRSHHMNSSEYQSAAAWEGWAHFYSILAFNNTGDSDCQFYYYQPIDWDYDSNDEMTRVSSCAVAPQTGLGLSAGDYLDDLCTVADNRAVEYDWLRFWWDLVSTEAVSTATVGQIWDDAEPHSWVAQDPSPPVGFLKKPAYRLRQAADTNGVLTEWDNQDEANGVHR
jgi:hypothetical protein